MFNQQTFYLAVDYPAGFKYVLAQVRGLHTQARQNVVEARAASTPLGVPTR